MALFKKGGKTNWDRISNQEYKDTMKGRDVYEDQQLERTSIQPMSNMTSRNIMNVCICVLVFICVWMFITLLDYAFSGKGEIELSANPAANWFYVEEHYVNPEDTTERLTLEEFQVLEEVYQHRDEVPEVEDPGREPIYVDVEDGWQFKLNHYENKDTGEEMATGAYREMVANAKAEFEEKHTAWEEAKEAYDAYVKTQTNPGELYRKQKAHYRNRQDTEQYILPDEYEKLVSEYESDVSAGKFSEDVMGVPVLPFDPAELYRPGEEDEDGEVLEYVSKFDGRSVTKEEFMDMKETYRQELTDYKAAYMEHRAEFHPDDVDGTKKTAYFGPTLPKVGFSFVISFILFSILYMVLKKNLDAYNQMSDVADINQYHNDQHVALIEEVQRNYDWFPDVGAHSAVAVSSMISHMALSNKGLKKVEIAERAEKDILDEDGDVEYYKGEVLLGEDGKPITRTLPMIDEKFMDELFDASGAAKDPQVRRRFDATKIPYNADGENRDKLGKFATVAELINEDWEIPLYEPQRPAGAYIVDTAPVDLSLGA